MKRGDMVEIVRTIEGFPRGTVGIVEEFVDENLVSGRMCYLKVIIPEMGKSFYISPGSVEIISEAR